MTKKELRHQIACAKADVRESVANARKAIREGDYAFAAYELAEAQWQEGEREALERMLEEWGDE